MKNPATHLILVALTSSASSQITNFSDADPMGRLVTSAENWDNGLPTAGTSGILAQDATYDSGIALVGYDITQTGGTLTRDGGFQSLVLGEGTVLRLADPAAQISNTRGISVNGSGASLILDAGLADFSENNRDSTVNGTGTMVINGGSLIAGRHLYVQNGDLTVEGGTVTVAQDLGSRNFHPGGNLTLNGGTISATYLTFGTDGLGLNLGGTTPGSLVIENFGGIRSNVNHIDIDFKPGSQMSMQLTNPVEQEDYLLGNGNDDGDNGWTAAGEPLTGLEWAQALWESGRLSYNDDRVSGVDILGEGNTTVLTWAQAQVDLGDGAAFVFDSPTSHLSLTGGVTPGSLAITSFDRVEGSPAVWQVSIQGRAGAAYVFRAAPDLNFPTASPVENLTPGVPAAGTIGGTTGHVVTADGSGQATVRMTLAGDPTNLIRAEEAP